MKFVVSTKPLSDGLNLGIVNANVSKYYQKSTLAQISAKGNTLKINLEAASILSEIVLKGSSDEPNESIIFVDCLLFKQLISTIETPTVTLEFTDNGLIVHSGKSKFTLARMVDDDVDVKLASPSSEYNTDDLVDIKKPDWKFVKDFQMFALSMSLIYPVYTKVYISEQGDVIVGDFDNSLFTYSNKSNLGKTCLLSDTVINLLNSLPEDSKLINLGNSYLIKVSTDSYEFSAEFTPMYENTDGVGDFNAPVLLGLLGDSNEDSIYKSVNVDISNINKALNQSALLSNSSEDVINVEVSANTVRVFDNNIDCPLPAKGETANYSVLFKTNILKSVISNAPSDDVTLIPMLRDDEVTGIKFIFKELSVVLAGAEE